MEKRKNITSKIKAEIVLSLLRGEDPQLISREYRIDFNETNVQKVTMGEWTWETGMNLDQISDFERIRDYGMLVVYSNCSYLKTKVPSKRSTKTGIWIG